MTSRSEARPAGPLGRVQCAMKYVFRMLRVSATLWQHGRNTENSRFSRVHLNEPAGHFEPPWAPLLIQRVLCCLVTPIIDYPLGNKKMKNAFAIAVNQGLNFIAGPRLFLSLMPPSSNSAALQNFRHSPNTPILCKTVHNKYFNTWNPSDKGYSYGLRWRKWRDKNGVTNQNVSIDSLLCNYV